MKEQDYLDIEAYLQGELSPESSAALEARAAAEPAFATALAERQLLSVHLRAEGEVSALRETLVKLTTKHFVGESASGTSSASPGPGLRKASTLEVAAQRSSAVVKPLQPRKTKWFAIMAAAAAIVLLLVFGGRTFFNDTGSTYDQFAQHQPLSLTERGEGDNGITSAEAAFNDGRYTEAIASLQQYVELNKEDARARLALGISHLETGNNTEAVRILTEVAETGGSISPYGNWYLALAAVHRDDNSAALRYLDRIPAGDLYLEERVTELRQVLAE